MNASYRKKSKRRHTRSLTSCIGHASRPHPACGQEKREPGSNPIVMCDSRLPPSPSRNPTPETLQGSGDCKAAVNDNVVSIPPNYPPATSTRPAHPHQTAKSLYFSLPFVALCLIFLAIQIVRAQVSFDQKGYLLGISLIAASLIVIYGLTPLATHLLANAFTGAGGAFRAVATLVVIAGLV